jgi:hypothetical protein
MKHNTWTLPILSIVLGLPIFTTALATPLTSLANTQGPVKSLWICENPKNIANERSIVTCVVNKRFAYTRPPFGDITNRVRM